MCVQHMRAYVCVCVCACVCVCVCVCVCLCGWLGVSGCTLAGGRLCAAYACIRVRVCVCNYLTLQKPL